MIEIKPVNRIRGFIAKKNQAFWTPDFFTS